MNVNTQTLEKNMLELTIEIPNKDLKPYLEKAAEHISQSVKVDGFRPGKAPYEAIVKKVGEMGVYEQALEPVVRDTFAKAVLTSGPDGQAWETIGQPQVDIQKFAPNNPLIYKATVALLPKVTLPNLDPIKVEKKKVEVGDERVEQSLKELQKMQTSEAAVDRAATKEDKVVLDMKMFLDSIPVDGGQANDHAIFLAEEYYVPGLNEKLIGMKKGDKKEFDLPFPKDHFQKNLSGKNVSFKISLKEVFELKPPALDDELAKKLGQPSLKKLKELIAENMKKEEEVREMGRQENEMFDKIIAKAKFDEVPELLINSEIEKMISELQASISGRGLSFEDYLKHIKKSVADLKLEFTTEALKRVQVALVVREVVREQKMEISKEEIEVEQKELFKHYQEDKETQERIKSPDGVAHIRSTLLSRKVSQYLREKIIA